MVNAERCQILLCNPKAIHICRRYADGIKTFGMRYTNALYWDREVVNCDEEEKDDNVLFEDNSEILNLPEEDTRNILNCEQRVEKRPRGSSDENINDNEFITVTRKKSKYRIVSDSICTQNEKAQIEYEIIHDKHEVSMTSLKMLPKQFAMAKLLRDEDIQNIVRIKYKGPYKVLIQFNSADSADKLLKCTKMVDLGFKCMMTMENRYTYGVVKGVDLELDEKEILENLTSEYEVIAVKRLKRVDYDGKWINSEACRISFKGDTLPTYVTGYGVRFKVEPFLFPVSQCSGCWKFGHFLRFCPTRKILCPKCGGNHDNCETKELKCLNCKGPHFVLDKNCPMFVKEKKIRVIMSEINVTYRKALEIYMQKNYSNVQVSDSKYSKKENIIMPNSKKTQIYNKNLYSSKVASEALIEMDCSSRESENEKEDYEKKII
ncbi:unnamed protein product [Euphydryas editha]|uniref:Gag-like protein n=1 Tax=Euphydryas editha TaxID=104508 RepID=A0AAU9T8T0_EUPED|nr:unnamed protein product [Euphydryas editha]